MRKAIADITKRLQQDNTVKYLKTFLACSLIHLDKQLGVRQIGIGEVLIRFIGKVVTKLLKRVFKATRFSQFYAAQDLGSEAAIHAVYEMFNKENSASINGRHTEHLQCNKSGGISP